MEITKVTAVYFSPTGGTKKVMQILAESMGKPWEEMDITDYEAGRNTCLFGEDELVLFGIPVYGGRVPAAAVEKIKLISGSNTPSVLVGVYGNRAYDDAILELKNITASNGFIPAAAIGAAAEHSIMRQYGAGRPDEADKAELERFAAEIMDKLSAISSADRITELRVKGNRDYREYNGVPLKPKADRECQKCGLCAEKCPVHAISPENPSKTDNDICISCMRCIAICPSNARSLNKLKLAVASKSLEKACKERKENEFFIF